MTENSKKRRVYLDVMERYVDALIRKNTGIVPVAHSCKATFNGIEGPIGQNEMWANTLYIQQRQVFTDIVSGNIVLFGVCTNEFVNFQGGGPHPVEGDNMIKPTYMEPFHAITVIRLHLSDGLIDEIEEIFEDKRYSFLRTPYSEIKLPELIYDIPIPEEERMTRKELKEAVDSYWDCIAHKISPEDLPVHPECVRYENGMCCTNNHATFRGEFRIEQFSWETPKELRFFPVIDEARGVVISMQRFLPNCYGHDNFNQYICEVFKVQDGLLRWVMGFWKKGMKEIGWRSEQG